MKYITLLHENQIPLSKLHHDVAMSRILSAIAQLEQHNLATQTRIATVAQVSVRHAQRILEQLDKHGDISSSKNGRYRYYTLSQDIKNHIDNFADKKSDSSPSADENTDSKDDTPAANVLFTATEYAILSAIARLEKQNVAYLVRIASVAKRSTRHTQRVLAQLTDKKHVETYTSDRRRFFRLTAKTRHTIEEKKEDSTHDTTTKLISSSDIEDKIASMSSMTQRIVKNIASSTSPQTQKIVASEAKCSVRHARRILKELAGTGYLVERRTGKQVFYTKTSDIWDKIKDKTHDSSKALKKQLINKQIDSNKNQLVLIENRNSQSAGQLDIPIQCRGALGDLRIPFNAAAETLMFADDDGLIAKNLERWSEAWRDGKATAIGDMAPSHIWQSIVDMLPPPGHLPLWTQVVDFLKNNDDTVVLRHYTMLETCRMTVIGGRYTVITPDADTTTAIKSQLIKQLRHALASVLQVSRIGYIEVQTEVVHMESELPEDIHTKQIESRATRIWEATQKILLGQTTKALYNSVIANTTADINDGMFIVTTQNQYAADWMEHRMRTIISRTLKVVTDGEFAELIIQTTPELKSVIA